MTSWYLEIIRKEGKQALEDSAPLSPYPKLKADVIRTVAQEKASWQPRGRAQEEKAASSLSFEPNMEENSQGS